MYTYAELFAGAGGMSLGLEAGGFHAFAHAEIEPHARAVLRNRWPGVRLDGDVTQINGADYAGVTLLSGGSPCQDLSVAGKRAGLIGSRSSLFHEQCRIWRESGAPYLLWENVLGALSSNNGRDFATVLSTIVGSTVHVPADGWRGGGGVVAGRDAVAAFRVLDLQHFGPPQRRVRVFVFAARTGGVDPAEVLALSQGVCGHPSPRDQTREKLAARVGGGVEGGVIGIDQECNAQHDRTTGGMGALAFAENQQGQTRLADVTQALAGGGGKPGQGYAAVLAFQNTGQGWWNHTDTAQTLRTPCGGDSTLANVVCATGHITHALTHEGADASEDGTGRGTPIVTYGNVGMESWKRTDVAVTLSARDGKGGMTLALGASNEATPVLAARAAAKDVRPLWADTGAQAVRNAPRRPEGVHAPEVLRPSMHGCGVRREAGEGESVVDDGAPPCAEDVCAESLHCVREGGPDGRASHQRELAGQQTGEPDAPLSVVPHQNAPFNGRPRRLTPLEAERLMSWPDQWTATGTKDDGTTYALSDTARYRLCGNGVGSVCAEWIARRLHDAITAADSTE